jgi:cytochrome c551
MVCALMNKLFHPIISERRRREKLQKVPFAAFVRLSKRFAFAGSAILLVALLAACGGGSGGGASPSSPSASNSVSQPLEGPEETVKLYRDNCISCHGTEMQGNMGPDSNLQQVGSRLDKEQIRKQIENGGNLMPAFKSRLQPEQIEALSDWLAGHK